MKDCTVKDCCLVRQGLRLEAEAEHLLKELLKVKPRKKRRKRLKKKPTLISSW